MGYVAERRDEAPAGSAAAYFDALGGAATRPPLSACRHANVRRVQGKQSTLLAVVVHHKAGVDIFMAPTRTRTSGLGSTRCRWRPSTPSTRILKEALRELEESKPGRSWRSTTSRLPSTRRTGPQSACDQRVVSPWRSKWETKPHPPM